MIALPLLAAFGPSQARPHRSPSRPTPHVRGCFLVGVGQNCQIWGTRRIAITAYQAMRGEAGWSDVRIDGHELACTIDWPGGDGIEARVATLTENELGRLLSRQLAEPEKAAMLADVRATLRDRVVDGAVRLHASVWLVTARS